MEVGDGTTSVVILAGEFLKGTKSFIEEGVHPRLLVRAYRWKIVSAFHVCFSPARNTLKLENFTYAIKILHNV